MYFLIDATSFYCSAEKVFAPHLRKRPTITLSNDGAIVAVCPIAKRLGIKKLVPFFQVRDLVNKHNVVVTSSNYELYQSLSNKMMDTIARFADDVHIYSIDELFARFDKPLNHESWLSLGLEIRKTVWKEVRLPVGAGGGPTPTLAKAAIIVPSGEIAALWILGSLPNSFGAGAAKAEAAKKIAVHNIRK